MIDVGTISQQEGPVLPGYTNSLSEIEEENAASSLVVVKPGRTEYSNVISLHDRKRKKSTTWSSVSQQKEFSADRTTYRSLREIHPDQPSTEFREVMRAHLVNPILDALQQVQPNVGSSGAAVYINRILHRIRQMENQVSDDPLLRVLFALYDALAFSGQWANYSASQYETARVVLLSCSAHIDLRPKRVQDAITKLEEIGFDTIPFGLNKETDA